MKTTGTVLVTGGAGYVGSALVPKLLSEGYSVRVLDLFIYGERVFDFVANHPQLTSYQGDIRDEALLRKATSGCDAVIHLACISNDPSFELDPDLGKSINYDAFLPLVGIARDCGVRRFVYASSSSVYGVKEEEQVTEALPLEPLTDYSKYKALCEDVLLAEKGSMIALTVRPATVCGYAPRLRLDLTVNILTNHAHNRREITVFGGSQQRPNLHVEDMTDFYLQSLQWPGERIDGRVYNVGSQNYKVRDIADIVKGIVGDDVRIVTQSTDDLRSYRISSEKIKSELGFAPRHTIQDAVRGLTAAFSNGRIPNSLEDPVYYNIKTMQNIKLQ